MFGYLRPLQGELKVYELERFRACYCGLCRAIGSRYGRVARFVLSYELVFLSMLLWDRSEPLEVKSGRCMASPLRKKKFCKSNAAMNACAGYNVILSWWKLRDAIADEPFIKSLPYRAFALLLHRAYKKASRDYTGFSDAAGHYLAELARYETGAGATLDGAADKFANILSAAAEGAGPESVRRPLTEILYHIGRWIYIVDACDDYGDDVSAKRYNPVAVKFPPEQSGGDGEGGGKRRSRRSSLSGNAGNGGDSVGSGRFGRAARSRKCSLPEAGRERIGTTLAHSNNLVCSAFELLPENVWSQTVRNTIYLGMPDVCARVMSGDWPPAVR